jgi:cobaltochelatase CobS
MHHFLTKSHDRFYLLEQLTGDLRVACRELFTDNPHGTSWTAFASKTDCVDAIYTGDAPIQLLEKYGKPEQFETVPPYHAIQEEFKEFKMPTPSPEPATGANAKQQAILDLLSTLATPGTDPQETRRIIAEEVQKAIKALPPKELLIKIGALPEVKLSGQHPQFETLVKSSTIGTVCLVGPAGSGKTSAGKMLSQALSQEFTTISTGAQTSKSDIFGFISATGAYVQSAVHRAMVEGHVLLLDEFDTCNAGVSKQMNGIIDHDTRSVEFPSGKVEKHDDFRVIVAMNTTGRGADRQYVGGRQQDASTLNRMFWITWDYDTAFERELTLAQGCDTTKAEDWIQTIDKIREEGLNKNLRVVIGTRAKIMGARALKAGFSKKDALNLCLFDGMSVDEAELLKRATK